MHLIGAGVGGDTTKPASEKQSAQRLYIHLLKLQQHKGSLHKSPLEKTMSMDAILLEEEGKSSLKEVKLSPDPLTSQHQSSQELLVVTDVSSHVDQSADPWLGQFLNKDEKCGALRL